MSLDTVHTVGANVPFGTERRFCGDRLGGTVDRIFTISLGGMRSAQTEQYVGVARAGEASWSCHSVSRASTGIEK